MRLIDADALKKAIPNTHVDIFENCRNCRLLDDEQVKQLIDDTLTVELPKEHQGTGCWEWITEDKYRCSECQNTTYVDECLEEPQYLYCPYCGSKMTFAGRN